VAHLRIDGLDETLREMEKLGRMDEVAPKAVEAAAPILEKAEKAAVRAAARAGYGKGSLVKSIKATKVKENQYGFYSVVKPNGSDSRGESNSDKLLRLNYGTSRQLPRPCLQKAVDAAEKPCMDKMEEVIARELGLE